MDVRRVETCGIWTYRRHAPVTASRSAADGSPDSASKTFFGTPTGTRRYPFQVSDCRPNPSRASKRSERGDRHAGIDQYGLAAAKIPAQQAGHRRPPRYVRDDAAAQCPHAGAALSRELGRNRLWPDGNDDLDHRWQGRRCGFRRKRFYQERGGSWLYQPHRHAAILPVHVNPRRAGAVLFQGDGRATGRWCARPGKNVGHHGALRTHTGPAEADKLEDDRGGGQVTSVASVTPVIVGAAMHAGCVNAYWTPVLTYGTCGGRGNDDSLTNEMQDLFLDRQT